MKIKLGEEVCDWEINVIKFFRINDWIIDGELNKK